MTTKQSINWIVNELNTEGSRSTLNGKNNHITYEYIPDGRYYNLFKDGKKLVVHRRQKSWKQCWLYCVQFFNEAVIEGRNAYEILVCVSY